MLVLLFLLSQSRKGATPHGGGGHVDPHAFPPDGGGLRPASYGGGGASSSEWTPYKPLTPEVIARAQALLSDASKVETIEPDPSHPGEVVRYLRTPDTRTGKVNVTAWRATHPGTHMVKS